MKDKPNMRIDRFGDGHVSVDFCMAYDNSDSDSRLKPCKLSQSEVSTKGDWLWVSGDGCVGVRVMAARKGYRVRFYEVLANGNRKELDTIHGGKICELVFEDGDLPVIAEDRNNLNTKARGHFVIVEFIRNGEEIEPDYQPTEFNMVLTGKPSGCTGCGKDVKTMKDGRYFKHTDGDGNVCKMSGKGEDVIDG